MEDSDVAYCKIHPSIGIARLGNSPDAFYIAPELPGGDVVPIGGFKDLGDPRLGIPPRVKRQAARFRIFAYNSSDRPIGEITLKDADIRWTVHLANRKAEWDRFAGTSGEELPLDQRQPEKFWRNINIQDRGSLIIDPGDRTVSRVNSRATFDNGKFRRINVHLGNLMTDDKGRLLVLGGHGVSGTSRPGNKILNYANNDLWYDDTSDGPVTATVTLKNETKVQVTPAWVIVAPPDFAPAVINVVTLYDVCVDVAYQHGLLNQNPAPPSFTNDIFPIFARLDGLQWVQQSAFQRATVSLKLKNIRILADASDATKSLRREVFESFRNPNIDNTSDAAKKQANDLYMPPLSGDGGDAAVGQPARWLSLTRTQYRILERWASGDFISDWTGKAAAADDDITPQGLDRAALEACSGGAFYPGIEAGWVMRNRSAYHEAFRLAHDKFKAGDITKRMACPWQADFFECRQNWWPAQRPDEVLTQETYLKILQLDEKILEVDKDTALYRELQAMRRKAWENRTLWTRGIPQMSPDGDNEMVNVWPQHGFIVNKTQVGPIELEGKTVFVETERNKYDGLRMSDYFHVLTNIEQHPDFYEKAKQLATSFFSNARFDVDEKYAAFNYSPEAFDARLEEIYEAFVAEMGARPWLDTGSIGLPVVVGRDGDRDIKKVLTFEVGRFSDRVVKERIRQMAPFNLVDGAWLQNVQSTGPSDKVKANLFSIWNDEAGNGLTEQNHCNVYETLLRSIGIYVPPITSKEFLDQDLLPSAFTGSVFQLAVSLFPEEFYPEILGMTLYLEWEATPTLTPAVDMLKGRNIDPHFYRLHVAIDNISVGHGALAKEAIKLYLARVSDEGGDDAVQAAWQRIWRGYVTWATLGGLGEEFFELALVMDHKKVDLSYPLMIVEISIKDHSALFKLFAQPGNNLTAYLVSRFRDITRNLILNWPQESKPTQALIRAVIDDLNFIIQGESIFEEQRFTGVSISEEAKSLIITNPDGEDLVKLNRVLLSDAFPDLIARPAKTEPQWYPDEKEYLKKKVKTMIRAKAKIAKPLHVHKQVAGANLAELFDDPDTMLAKLIEAGFFDFEHPRDSRFFQLLEFSGPMYEIFSENEKDLLLDWMESMRQPQGSQPAPPEGTPQEWAMKVEEFIKANADAARRISKHAGYFFEDENGRIQSVDRWVDDPRGFMAALKRSDWIKPYQSNQSRFYMQFIGTGPMAGLGSNVANIIKQWIDTGAYVSDAAPQSVVDMGAAMQISLMSPVAFGGTQAPQARVPVAASARRTYKDSFAKKRPIIGMGSVH